MRKTGYIPVLRKLNLGGEKNIVYIVTQKDDNNDRRYQEKLQGYMFLLNFSAQNHISCFMYGNGNGGCQW